ncbi:MAG: hypothetical protein M3N45_10435 [Actinomycetota bacterium]|nr:hypothetical protein [Actinomycetota bacterium]
MRELQWPIPAAVLVGMTDEDLDRLAAAPDRDTYWRVLNGVVGRIESRSSTVDRLNEEAA